MAAILEICYIFYWQHLNPLMKCLREVKIILEFNHGDLQENPLLLYMLVALHSDVGINFCFVIAAIFDFHFQSYE